MTTGQIFVRLLPERTRRGGYLEVTDLVNEYKSTRHPSVLEGLLHDVARRGAKMVRRGGTPSDHARFLLEIAAAKRGSLFRSVEPDESLQDLALNLYVRKLFPVGCRWFYTLLADEPKVFLRSVGREEWKKIYDGLAEDWAALRRCWFVSGEPARISIHLLVRATINAQAFSQMTKNGSSAAYGAIPYLYTRLNHLNEVFPGLSSANHPPLLHAKYRALHVPFNPAGPLADPNPEIERANQERDVYLGSFTRKDLHALDQDRDLILDLCGGLDASTEAIQTLLTLFAKYRRAVLAYHKR